MRVRIRRWRSDYSLSADNNDVPPIEVRSTPANSRNLSRDVQAVHQLFTKVAMNAEFEADPTRQRTREGMKKAKAKDRQRGKAPKLSAKQEAHLVALHKAGGHTSAELAELFGVAR
jgi:DNA invertase Pin-like site-specific DNA recombinase